MNMAPLTCCPSFTESAVRRPCRVIGTAAVLWLVAIGLFPAISAFPAMAGETAGFPGKQSEWNGYPRYDFEVDGKPVMVIAPHQTATGRPWVWHGEFFGHKPAPDIALLGHGFHIVYMRVPNLLGAPSAVKSWDACYQELTGKYGLAAKAALVGLSRGGLYCYNWAAANPEKVACIYGDAPVCDFKSWPGGKGKGKGSARDWQLVLKEYGFQDEAQALAYDKNPVDNLQPLARAGVPLLHVYGEADDVVPWEENTGLLAQRYRQLGGSITLIAKPGIGHHPHGLDDPTPIVDFIRSHAPSDPSAKAAPRRLDAVDQLGVAIEPSRQIVYKKAGGKELYLHLFEPDGWQATDRRPCFLIIHGGGWAGGVPRRMYPFAEHFARQGMVGVSLHYRRLGSTPDTTVLECVKDARSAIRFLRAHADELGIDPGRIVVSGGSAGGHLAVSTALFTQLNEAGEATETSAVPDALVLLFPALDISEMPKAIEKFGERWQELSPLQHVRAELPPTIIFQGTADTATPFAGAKAFQAAMKKAGNRCELVAHEGGRHGYLMFDKELFQDTLARTEKFLDSLDFLPAKRPRGVAP
ncbi:alpha/beta hydrolase [Lignipirellula cremea]|uniref:Carboxylesterase NlhH n=1 Tax=Lignipirellula cremea TaxID=2528010 RepID=A0A518DUA3_9BACT|nr:alpha/beta hydrolase fold domain-containing protein [Lignipirellula cremea]QDU95420.1 Carboxylesterase NlhH [Lignipirellula cremea]